jgi:hypothetical protein
MKKRQITYIIILLLFLVFFIQYGKKKGFNMLETYWIGFTLLFYVILEALSTSNKLILFLIVLKIKAFYMPIFAVTGVIFAICGDKFKTYRSTALALYRNLHLKMNTEKLSKGCTIYVANYPTNYIEYLTHGLFCDKLCVVVHGPAVKILKYIYGKEHTISVDKGSFDRVKKEIRDKMREGYSIFSYVEREYHDRKDVYDVCELRSGMFSIAKELNVTMTPVCIDHLDHIMGITNDTYFQIKVGDSFIVDNIEEDMARVKKFFKEELKSMKIPRLVKK